MKKKVLLLAVLSTFLLIGCGKSNNNSSSGGKDSSSGGGQKEEFVTVNFYADYNQKAIENVYYSCKVKNGSLITDIPNNPTEALYPDFPVFKGWSYKELIADEGDLWNFATDKVNTKYNTFDLYGYWVVEGE